MWRRYIWIALGVLFLWLRFQNVPGVFTEQGVVLNDTDPYYRLHRISKMVEGDLAYPLLDTRLSYPKGFEVPWPLGLDLVLATPLKLLGVSDPITIEMFSAAAIPLLAFPTLVFVGIVATQLFGSSVGLGAGFLLTVSAAAINAAAVGRMDHHFLEALFLALALFFLVALRNGRRFGRIGLICVLGLAPSFWPQAWVLSLFLSASFLMDRELRSRQSAGGLFFFSSLLSLLPLLFTERLGSVSISLFGFSAWSPLLYGSLSMAFLSHQFLFHRPTLPKPLALSAFVLGLGGLAYVLGVHGWSVFLSAKEQAIQALTASQGLLALTNEAISPLRLNPSTWLPLGLGTFFLAWIWFMLQAFRRSRWWLVGFFIGPLILAFMQARFVGMAMPIISIAAAQLVFELLERRISNASRRAWCFAAILGLLVFPARPNWGWTHRTNTHPLYAPVRDVAEFLLTKQNPSTDIPPNQSIAAHWDFGHWLLYYADMSVVAHPFQGRASWETLEMFCSESESEFQSYMLKHPVRYLLVEAPNRRMRKWLDLMGRDLNRYFIPQVTSQGEPYLHASEEMLKLQVLRFFVNHGQDSTGHYPPDWRLVYVSPFPNPDDPSMPALKLFEKVPGTVLSAQTDAKGLTLEGKIVIHNQTIPFKQTPFEEEQGRISWRVPYANVDHGGVRFSGRYIVRDTHGNAFPLPVVVSEQDVIKSSHIDVGPLPW